MSKRGTIRDTISAYEKFKGESISQAAIGFIERNKLIGKKPEEIDALITDATKMSGGVLYGEGDRFKVWCEKMGREVPDDGLVELMNRDPYAAREEMRGDPTKPMLYRAMLSYLAGRGRRNVRALLRP